jgi:hypothetical protein
MKRAIDERVVLAAAAAVGNHYVSLNEPIPFHPAILFAEPHPLSGKLTGCAALTTDAQADELVAYARTLNLVQPAARLVAALPDGDEQGMDRTRRVHIRGFCDLMRAKRMQFVAFTRSVLKAMTGRNASLDEVKLVELSMAGMLEKALADYAAEMEAPTTTEGESTDE